MNLVEPSFDGKVLTVALNGHIDAKNAPEVEKELFAAHDAHPDAPIVLDCSDLEYISSAGLRVVIRLLKAVADLSVINVTPEVYEVFDMTGFTMMMDVQKGYRRVSVEGCPIIGQGAKGVLYRLDPETVCKAYRDPDSLDDINRERELAKAAFVAGIPTAISFEVVRVGEGYGSVFELLNADTMGDLLVRGIWDVERVAQEMADLLIQMSETVVDTVLMPSARVATLNWVGILEGVLDDESYDALRSLIAAIPDVPYMVHGDFHMGNVMVQNGEPLIIDMDTLSHGDSIFDLITAYSTYVGRGLLDPQNVEKFLGISYEESCRLWDLILRKRLPGAAEEELRTVEDKVRLMSAMRLMGRPLRHKDIDPDLARRTYELYGDIIHELLPRVDSLALGKGNE